MIPFLEFFFQTEPPQRRGPMMKFFQKTLIFAFRGIIVQPLVPTFIFVLFFHF